MARVSHSLTSCTLALKPFPVPHPQDISRRLVFVDAMGFNSPAHSDSEILQRMVSWLEYSWVPCALSYLPHLTSSSYPPGKTCGGLIYLHDITDTHICSNTLNQILESFQGLESFVYATTRSEKLPTQAFIKRYNELQKKYLERWMSQGGSVFNLLSDSPASAQALVNIVVSRCSSKLVSRFSHALNRTMILWWLLSASGVTRLFGLFLDTLVSTVLRNQEAGHLLFVAACIAPNIKKKKLKAWD